MEVKNNLKLNIKYKILNGQKIYFLSEDEWQILLREGRFSIFQFGIRSINLLKNKDYPISKKYKEIFLGIGFVPSGFCLPYTFLKEKDEYLRIQIEYRRCSNCSKKIIIGNSKDATIYVGIPDYINKLELMKKSDKLIKKSCPNCRDKKFSDLAIWSVIDV